MPEVDFLLLCHIWCQFGKELKILLDNELDSIQAKVNAFVTPDDIGRIPFKISSFSGFTAEQWKNLVIKIFIILIEGLPFLSTLPVLAIIC